MCLYARRRDTFVICHRVFLIHSLDAEVRGAFLRGTENDDFMGEAKKQ